MQQQLTFRLQELPSGGRAWSLQIPKAVFEDAGIGSVEPPSRLCRDVDWSGSVIFRDAIYVLSGEWCIELVRQCVRCNEEFPMRMEGRVERCYLLGDARRGSDESDSCEYLAPPGQVNLVDLIREELWLAWKPMAICSESCKGLCQQCGENLNKRQCGCNREDENHPFAALRNIRFDT